MGPDLWVGPLTPFARISLTIIRVSHWVSKLSSSSCTRIKHNTTQSLKVALLSSAIGEVRTGKKRDQMLVSSLLLRAPRFRWELVPPLLSVSFKIVPTISNTTKTDFNIKEDFLNQKIRKSRIGLGSGMVLLRCLNDMSGLCRTFSLSRLWVLSILRQVPTRVKMAASNSRCTFCALVTSSRNRTLFSCLPCGLRLWMAYFSPKDGFQFHDSTYSFATWHSITV